MRILTLDVRATHVNNPDCPMRLVPHPDGRNWICLDCGFEIVMKWVELHEETQERTLRCAEEPECVQPVGALEMSDAEVEAELERIPIRPENKRFQCSKCKQHSTLVYSVSGATCLHCGYTLRDN